MGHWQQLDDQAGQVLVEIARQSLTRFLAQGERFFPDIAQLAPLLRAEGASFVTLTRQGQLRGCIGSTQPRWPLADDVARNAVAAASSDPRFSPVTTPELATIRLEVTVLTPPLLVNFTDFTDLCRQLRPGIDGVMLTRKARRGLLLPQVWRRIPETADFLKAIAHKAGIPLAELQYSPPSITAHTFQVQHFQENGYLEPGG